jgi:hypothetical protein
MLSISAQADVESRPVVSSHLIQGTLALHAAFGTPARPTWALRVEAWCNDSIRIRINPGNTTDPGVTPVILNDLPGALTED